MQKIQLDVAFFVFYLLLNLTTNLQWSPLCVCVCWDSVYLVFLSFQFCSCQPGQNQHSPRESVVNIHTYTCTNRWCQQWYAILLTWKKYIYTHTGHVFTFILYSKSNKHWENVVTYINVHRYKTNWGKCDWGGTVTECGKMQMWFEWERAKHFGNCICTVRIS